MLHCSLWYRHYLQAKIIWTSHVLAKTSVIQILPQVLGKKLQSLLPKQWRDRETGRVLQQGCSLKCWQKPSGAEPQMKHAVRTSPIWGSLGPAQLLRVRLQGMNSMRHTYHVTKHSGLWLNNTEDATQAHKLSTVTLCAALAPGVEMSLGAQLHMVPLSPLPASPSPLTSQYLHFGPQDGQGSSSGSTTPAQTKQTLPGTRWAELGSSLTCSHLCGCVWASPVQIHPTVHELSPALFGYDLEIQKCRGENQSQHINIWACSSSLKGATRPLYKVSLACEMHWPH